MLSRIADRVIMRIVFGIDPLERTAVSRMTRRGYSTLVGASLGRAPVPFGDCGGPSCGTGCGSGGDCGDQCTTDILQCDTGSGCWNETGVNCCDCNCQCLGPCVCAG